MTHQQKCHEERESELQRIEAARDVPNTVSVTAACMVKSVDNARRITGVYLTPDEALTLADKILPHLDAVQLRKLSSRIDERLRCLRAQERAANEPCPDTQRGGQS